MAAMRMRRRHIEHLGRIVISASITALVGSCTEPQVIETPEDSSTPTVVAGSCPAAPLSLSRLPWLEAGSEVHAPELINEGESSLLVWFEDPVERWDSRHVALTRSTRPLIDGSLDEFPTVSVRGHSGHLVWVGDPGVGELSVVWTEPSVGACSWYALTLLSRGMSEVQAETEIQRIAESLGDARTTAYCMVPSVELGRSVAHPGDRVSFEGECVPQDWDGGYGLFLLHDSPTCELIAGGGDLHIDVRPNGDATGSFSVPPVGYCFQSTASSPRALPPGRYTLGLGCHACLLPETTIRIERRPS